MLLKIWIERIKFRISHFLKSKYIFKDKFSKWAMALACWDFGVAIAEFFVCKEIIMGIIFLVLSILLFLLDFRRYLLSDEYLEVLLQECLLLMDAIDNALKEIDVKEKKENSYE